MTYNVLSGTLSDQPTNCQDYCAFICTARIASSWLINNYESALQTVFRAVVVAKMMHGSSAWRGFASVTNRQKLEAFIRRSIRVGFYIPDLDYDFEQLCNKADHRLFNMILKSQSHMYWNNCCHPLFHISIILGNDCIIDRFHTAVLI